MKGELKLSNRQRSRAIDKRFLERIIRHSLQRNPAEREFDLTVHIIGSREMARLNETKLRHAGATDVITFDYCSDEPNATLAGDIYVCIDEIAAQAKHYRASWQSELIRCIIHGVLHLEGYDDTASGDRRRMKREESRLLKQLENEFHLSKLQRKP